MSSVRWLVLAWLILCEVSVWSAMSKEMWILFPTILTGIALSEVVDWWPW